MMSICITSYGLGIFRQRQDNDDCAEIIYTRDYYEAKFTHDYDDFATGFAFLYGLLALLLV